MSTNKFQPHVLIFPEDDANRQIANGFLLLVPPDRQRRAQCSMRWVDGPRSEKSSSRAKRIYCNTESDA